MAAVVVSGTADVALRDNLSPDSHVNGYSNDMGNLPTLRPVDYLIQQDGAWETGRGLLVVPSPPVAGVSRTLQRLHITASSNSDNKVAFSAATRSFVRITTGAMHALADGLGTYGTGQDGDITISGAVTFSRPMFFRDVTITSTGAAYLTGSGAVFISGTLYLPATHDGAGAYGCFNARAADLQSDSFVQTYLAATAGGIGAFYGTSSCTWQAQSGSAASNRLSTAGYTPGTGGSASGTVGAAPPPCNQFGNGVAALAPAGTFSALRAYLTNSVAPHVQSVMSSDSPLLLPLTSSGGLYAGVRGNSGGGSGVNPVPNTAGQSGSPGGAGTYGLRIFARHIAAPASATYQVAYTLGGNASLQFINNGGGGTPGGVSITCDILTGSVTDALHSRGGNASGGAQSGTGGASNVLHLTVRGILPRFASRQGDVAGAENGVGAVRVTVNGGRTYLNLE